ncbi:hypothetical protein [Umezakia ovalisporum]|nr:hypothetical protein [Umezakia ovalisporum]MDH6084255.1 hypothetical protein [Umezakia ovalisporum TAC611]
MNVISIVSSLFIVNKLYGYHKWGVAIAPYGRLSTTVRAWNLGRLAERSL